MKGRTGFLVLAAVLMIGCAEHMTLEELELAAIESGDWSAVEQRERAIARRAARSGLNCGNGAVAVCESRGGNKRCNCVNNDSINRMLGGW